MTDDVGPNLFVRAAAAMRPPGEIEGELDVPALTDPVIGLQRSVTLLAAVTLVIVAITAGTRVGRGYTLGDVGTLLILYAIGTLALSRIPWRRLPSMAAVAIIGAQILFVVSLTTVTGGGRSPYFVLYGPILALAGWHLRREWVILAVGSVAIVEWWRATIIEGGNGTADQLMVALPLFAAIAALAHLTAERLLGAIAVIRRDQLRTAETLAAVRDLAAATTGDPLSVAAAAAARIFGARARLVTFEPQKHESGDLLSRSAEGRRLSVAITGAAGTHGVLELERTEPFSVTEARLAAMLSGTAGHAAEGRTGRGAHL
ncbi:MAG: hypothetical protein ABIZ52_03200 [Candidatus Limnocylindrales bacterium]